MEEFVLSDPATVEKTRCEASTTKRYFLTWPFSTTKDNNGDEMFYALSWELVTECRNQVIMSGSIRWDGCIDCSTEGLHFCDPMDINELADDLKMLYSHGDMIPSWSAEHKKRNARSN